MKLPPDLAVNSAPTVNLLQRAAGLWPSGVALLGKSGEVSFSELQHGVWRWYMALQDQGFRSGQKVMLRARSSQSFIELMLALVDMACPVIPVNPRVPEQQWQNLLQAYQPDRTIADLAIAPEFSHPVLIHSSPTSSSEDIQNAELNSDRPCVGVFTSGSTGLPKLAWLSYRNVFFNALGSQASMTLNPGNRVLLSLPLFHVGGLAIPFRCLLSGATLVLADELNGRVEEPGFLKQHQITHASLVATQLQRLLSRPSNPLCLNALIGGGPVPDALLKQAAGIGVQCWLTYGLTEMASQVLTHHPDGKARVLPYRELKLAENGEILVRGECLFLGYQEQQKIIRPLDDQGWFHTGDLGQWQGESFRVLGRQDNRFVCAGEKIQPEPIEQWLRQHELVEEALILPVPDLEYGTRPVAFVRLLNTELTPAIKQLLAEWVRIQWPSLMVPIRWYPLAQPAGMKVTRKQLEAQIADGDLDNTNQS